MCIALHAVQKRQKWGYCLLAAWRSLALINYCGLQPFFYFFFFFHVAQNCEDHRTQSLLSYIYRCGLVHVYLFCHLTSTFSESISHLHWLQWTIPLHIYEQITFEAFDVVNCLYWLTRQHSFEYAMNASTDNKKNKFEREEQIK